MEVKIQGRWGATCSNGTCLLLGATTLTKMYGSRKHTIVFLGSTTSIPMFI